MGPVTGQHSLGSTDGITFSLSPFDSDVPDSGDLTFALAGSAETAAGATRSSTRCSRNSTSRADLPSLDADLSVVLAGPC